MTENLVTPELLDAIAEAEWTWAKTYALTAPHWYIVRKNYPQLFAQLAAAIDAHGTRRQWRQTGYWNTYLEIGAFKYWHYIEVLNRDYKEAR